jgi:hypothetical protein
VKKYLEKIGQSKRQAGKTTGKQKDENEEYDGEDLAVRKLKQQTRFRTIHYYDTCLDDKSRPDLISPFAMECLGELRDAKQSN